MSEYINLATVGMACGIVGVIFLANSMGVRNPKRFIHEHFGVARSQPLRAVHQQMRVKAQIFTGFLFLMVCFSLQILSVAFGASAAPEASSDDPLRAVMLLLAGIIAATIVLRVGQNAWSLLVFRRLLTEFFQEQSDWNFEKHPAETREIGEILGVAPTGEDSIADYADRVRAALHLGTNIRPVVADDAFAPLRKLGTDRRP